MVNLFMVAQGLVVPAATADEAQQVRRPNVLIAISDDQSFDSLLHPGQPSMTPAMDRIAAVGVTFKNAIVPSPGCSPMRAAFLSGRHAWQCGAGGTHASDYPRDLPSFIHRLAAAGYDTGMTGKGWGPGKSPGWSPPPAGPEFNKIQSKTAPGISNRDYAANFGEFLKSRGQSSDPNSDDSTQSGDDSEAPTSTSSRPFCFWYGGHEPHRTYDSGIGERNGINPDELIVPPFLPDVPAVRSDLADYLYEISHFNEHLMRMLDHLQEIGELDNTIVIVTSDNGMPFPHAKANLYDYGIHVPLAIAWPAQIQQSSQIDVPVSLLDVTATIYSATGASAPEMAGTDLLPAMQNAAKVKDLPAVAFSSRERHSSSRFNTLGYPGRAMRTSQYLLIQNFRPQRWPAGPGEKYSKVVYDESANVVRGETTTEGVYCDIDGSPTLDYMSEATDSPTQSLLAAAVDLRPEFELFDIAGDPGCLENLIGRVEIAAVESDMRHRLASELLASGDLRATDPDAAERQWESYPRHSPLRWFPQPSWLGGDSPMGPDWLESRRPRQ